MSVWVLKGQFRDAGADLKGAEGENELTGEMGHRLGHSWSLSLYRSTGGWRLRVVVGTLFIWFLGATVQV